MALYTTLSVSQIAKIAALFGLPPPRRIRGVLEGTVNTYYQLTYPHKVYYLKIDEVASLKRLMKELKILRFLAARRRSLKFETPTPLPGRKGNLFIPRGKKFVLLFEKIEGIPASVNSLSTRKLTAIGRALGRLHKLHTPSMPPHRFDLPELEKVYHEIHPKLAKKHPLVDLEIRQWLGWMKKNEPRGGAMALIHADLFPENILFKGNHLEGIVDFEAAGTGSPLFDLATTLHACCHSGKTFSLPRCRAVLKGYNGVRPLGKKEKMFFEYYLFQSALRFLLTRLRDFELKEGKVRAKPFKDYRDFLRRFAEIPSLARSLGLTGKN